MKIPWKIPLRNETQMKQKLRNQTNLMSHQFQNQLKKINVTIAKLHEDLQHDYLQEIEELSL